jgi:hypothetical protein
MNWSEMKLIGTGKNDITFQKMVVGQCHSLTLAFWAIDKIIGNRA